MKSSPVYPKKDSLVKNERFIHPKPPLLSYQMKPHNYSYKPKGFSLNVGKLNQRNILVEFNFSYPYPYANFVIRMRYHGYQEEFMTKQITLEDTSPNRVVLTNFPSAVYILCVTLIPSMTVSAQRYPLLSTSDMCADLTFGEDIIVNDHKNKTGFLVPSLVILVFIILVVIAVVSKLRTSHCCKSKEFVQKQKEKNISMKKNAFNSIVGLNYLINFNKDYADMSHLVKMLVFEGDENVFSINPNESVSSITSLNTEFNKDLMRRKRKHLKEVHENLSFQSDSLYKFNF
ncbi:hypothetical protein BpHYR1_033228 [Brachionus plicatilis]|uniref:Uncharacterized protein n=1 Tax=Brachionus plicatilis TaxID=10195 RepID=A0A3M7PCS9_BRAPC|nr:hypothetical protein BpHYR1_033228 [Brachionus plicatilis]